MAARRMPLITVATAAAGSRKGAGRADYIDGEVIDVVDIDSDVVDVERPALPRQARLS